MEAWCNNLSKKTTRAWKKDGGYCPLRSPTVSKQLPQQFVTDIWQVPSAWKSILGWSLSRGGGHSTVRTWNATPLSSPPKKENFAVHCILFKGNSFKLSQKALNTAAFLIQDEWQLVSLLSRGGKGTTVIRCSLVKFYTETRKCEVKSA